MGVIREVHADNYEAYGYRRRWKALSRAGERVGRGRVQRLMAANSIQGAKRRGRPCPTTTPDPDAGGRRTSWGATSPPGRRTQRSVRAFHPSLRAR